MHDLIINRHVNRTNDPGKNNIFMSTEKITTPEDEFHKYLYYTTRIQRQFITTKRRCFRVQYSHQYSQEKLDNT